MKAFNTRDFINFIPTPYMYPDHSAGLFRCTSTDSITIDKKKTLWQRFAKHIRELFVDHSFKCHMLDAINNNTKQMNEIHDQIFNLNKTLNIISSIYQEEHLRRVQKRKMLEDPLYKMSEEYDAVVNGDTCAHTVIYIEKQRGAPIKKGSSIAIGTRSEFINETFTQAEVAIADDHIIIVKENVTIYDQDLIWVMTPERLKKYKKML